MSEVLEGMLILIIEKTKTQEMRFWRWFLTAVRPKKQKCMQYILANYIGKFIKQSRFSREALLFCILLCGRDDDNNKPGETKAWSS